MTIHDTAPASVGSSSHDDDSRDAVPVVPPPAPRFAEARGGPRETLARRLLNKPQHGKRAYLRDLAVYVPPASDFITKRELKAAIRDSGIFKPESCEFMSKVLDNAGLAEKTALSKYIIAMKGGSYRPSFKDCLEETETIATAVVADVLKKTGLHPGDIDAVITSCSCFAPTPSMAAMIVNKFKMRKDVQTYALAGMGCAASVLCADMAARLLASMPPNSNVLIFNHENITNNWYAGDQRNMLIVNCLFRAGGSACVMTNARRHAKYELVHAERTHFASVDAAFTCMGDAEDEQGKHGIFLERALVDVATDAIRFNLTRIAPVVLPFGELAKAVKDPKYVPKFGKAFDHFLLHTGGPAVLGAIDAALGLTADQLAASKDTLARFGNTSAASTWYTLACVETRTGVKKGDMLWQLGLGGGFKCTSGIWRAVRNIREAHAAWGPDVGALTPEEEALAAAEAATAVVPACMLEDGPATAAKVEAEPAAAAA